ncbi:MAG: acetyl-CoA hydrolase/transferase family protein [Deltaproteobacteria bacterium]|nr:acetyl-CoA hydrolase/transferase family protein [Deltaproteobacteria bacterium]
MKVKDAAEAVALVRSGQRVFVHGAAATPLRLLEALVARADSRADSLLDVELIHLHTAGPAAYADARYAKSFRVASLFVGENLRGRLDGARVDYLPCFLSEMPFLFRSGVRPVDVAFVQVSPPDAHGFCSLGTSVDTAKAAVDVAKVVVAEVNPRMPRTHGDGFIDQRRIARFLEVDAALPEPEPHQLDDVERAIGRHVAALIEDGSTLQMGIGAIPDAVLAALGGHRHLGVHTEMFSDGLLPLIDRGVVDNTKKAIHPGKTVSSFLFGSRALYDYVDDNQAVVLLDCGYVNRPNVIARNPRVVAINSAVEIDLTGQVCADSIGTRVISGVGGQMDFLRGAAMSEGGKPILALPSRTRTGRARIVPRLQDGAGVVTTRAHLHWLVTEHGAANLFGRTLHERAAALIALAHPDDREGLAKAWRDQKH